MSQGKEQSVKDRVKKIADQHGRTFGEVWQEVVLERWLARLAQSKYRKNFIFKGAMCLARYTDLQRQTKDLDFLLRDLQGSIEDVKNYLGEVAAISIDDGFTFESLDVQLLSHTHMQYPGYSVSVVAHLGKTRTKIFIDVGVGDAVKPTEITMRLLSTDKAPLFEKDIELWAYPVEFIFAEKLQTAIARSQENSRMKDYHDLIFLMRGEIVEIPKAKSAIQDTFTNRGTAIGPIDIPAEDTKKLQAYWNAYRGTLAETTSAELNADILEIIKEINEFLEKHELLK
nr:nucleotidyl transferase AbiEii/AbiGii toxin family protein [Bdellovibrio sp. HAGR004]